MHKSVINLALIISDKILWIYDKNWIIWNKMYLHIRKIKEKKNNNKQFQIWIKSISWLWKETVVSIQWFFGGKCLGRLTGNSRLTKTDNALFWKVWIMKCKVHLDMKEVKDV